jgi:hypothetical protein
MRTPRRRIGARVRWQRCEGGTGIRVPDLYCAVPRRGEECRFGDEVVGYREDFARVFRPGLDWELGYVDVEELDGAVAAGG